MELWDRLVALWRIMRRPGRRTFELDEKLYTALVARAAREQRPAEAFQEDIIAAGLAHLQTSERLQMRWETLSPREREVVAYSCLGYTNRQMAAKMGVSPETVKGYVRQALVKFQLHSKGEVSQALREWDFSEWGTPQR